MSQADNRQNEGIELPSRNDPLTSQLDAPSNPRGRTPPPSTDIIFSNSMSMSSQADFVSRTPRRAGGRRNDLGLDNPAFAQLLHAREHIDSSQTGGPGMDIDPSSAVDVNEKERVIWGTTIELNVTINAFKDFLVSFCPMHRKLANGQEHSQADTEPLYPKLLRQIRETEIFSLNLDCENLKYYANTTHVYHELKKYPQEIIPLMDMVIHELFVEMYPEMESADELIQVRPFNIGNIVNMRELNPSDIDQLVTVKGLVIRSSNIIPDMKIGFFKCGNCDFTFSVESIKGKIHEPAKCPREECSARRSLSLIHNRCTFTDKQLLKIQETPDSIPDGQTPHNVTVFLYDALVGVPRPGDRIEITGIYRATPIRPNPRQRRIRNLFRTYIDTVHIKRSAENRLNIGVNEMSSEEYMVSFDESDNIRHLEDADMDKIIELSKSPNLYERLSNSLAPSIWEMENVKKSLLLQLFGGVSKNLKKSSTAHFRGDINILLAGDPGVSKSQMLQFVHKLAPRGIYTSGKGSSAVGLTAYITKDPDTKQYVLESGALVLSDGGVCCIDEFDKMSDSTRAILHEVMEQQTVSVAKAGIITTLNARTSILASANPIDSKYNPKKSIVDNLNLPPTLLSRFDIICLLLDNVDETFDRRLAEHIVALYVDEAERPSNSQVIDSKLFTKYISFARKLQPVLTDAAIQGLIEGYLSMRRANGSGKTISATTRQLESLIRLSEAHAKMRLSETVEAPDVAEAIRLVKEAILSYAIDPVTGRIDMDMINTGRSSAVRERQADLKKEIKSLLSRHTHPSIDFNLLMTGMNEQSSIAIEEKWIRDVLEELIEEEFIHVTGNVHRGNCSIRRLI